MSRQTLHGKPIFDGHLSRLPFSIKEEYESAPVIKYLLQFQDQLPDKDDLDLKNINATLEKYNLKYFVLDLQRAKPNDSKTKNLIQYLTTNLGASLEYQDNFIQIYQKK